MKKTLEIFTSTRADFGLLRPLIDRLIERGEVEPQLFVTGTHLMDEFGQTVGEIEKSHALYIHLRVPVRLDGKDKLGTAHAMGAAIGSYASALQAQRPDFALVLGDRYEALCFGLACATLGIPLIHIHGGELTSGALDDKFRHCLTKLSDWHFVACEAYCRRVIQLGEAPGRVFNVGALGVENALHTDLIPVKKLEERLGRPLPNEVYLLTFHPETNSSDFGAGILEVFLQHLGERLRGDSAFVLVTGVNADPGCRKIKGILDEFVSKMGDRALYVESLGSVAYLSMVRISTAVVGNSSSGILEARSLGTPTVNLGLRQEGRVRESSVLDFPDALSLDGLSFQSILEMKKRISEHSEASVFGDGTTSKKMAERISSIAQSLGVGQNAGKVFFDLGSEAFGVEDF